MHLTILPKIVQNVIFVAITVSACGDLKTKTLARQAAGNKHSFMESGCCLAAQYLQLLVCQVLSQLFSHSLQVLEGDLARLVVVKQPESLHDLLFGIFLCLNLKKKRKTYTVYSENYYVTNKFCLIYTDRKTEVNKTKT